MRKIYVALLGLLFGAAGLSNFALSQDPKASRALLSMRQTVVRRIVRSTGVANRPSCSSSWAYNRGGVSPTWVRAGLYNRVIQRAVGTEGVVYGQNSKSLLEKFLEKPWSARLAKPVMKGTVRLDRDFDDPFPADLHSLDAVTMVLFYHDTVWLG